MVYRNSWIEKKRTLTGPILFLCIKNTIGWAILLRGDINNYFYTEIVTGQVDLQSLFSRSGLL